MESKGSDELLIPGQVFDQMPGADDSGFACPQRVLWVDPQADLLVTIGIEKGLKAPHRYSLSHISSLIRKELLRLLEVRLPPYDLKNEIEIPKRSIAVRERSWSIIEPLVSDEKIPDVFLPPDRGFLILSVSAEEDANLTLTKKIVSTKTWGLKYRSVMGSSRSGVFGPCARFEIDATVVDVYLVSVFNRAWIIGRPVLYVLVDVFSRMVVGFHLGLEGPSWEGARLALFNAFSSKPDFCRRYGIDIADYMWPCHHLPHKVECDNAEMKSKASDTLPREARIKSFSALHAA